MRIYERNRSTRIKTTPVPLCPAQIPPGPRWREAETNRLSYGMATEILKKWDHLNKRITLKCVLDKYEKDWIQVAQDKVKW
jgi:hypothetical protein